MATAYDASLIQRIMPRIKQFEATTGRKIHPTLLDSLISEQLKMESDRASRERAYDIQERGQDLQEQQFAANQEEQKDTAKAAKIKGAIDIGTTAGTLGLAYKAVSKPSAMSELLAYQKSLGATPTSLTTGAQTAIGGGVVPAGAQVLPGAVPGAASAPELAAITGQGAWVEPAASAIPGAGSAIAANLGPIAGLYGAQYLTGKAFQPYLEDVGFGTTGKGWTYAGLPGASIGATIDVGKKVVSEAKDIFSDIGDIFGW